MKLQMKLHQVYQWFLIIYYYVHKTFIIKKQELFLKAECYEFRHSMQSSWEWNWSKDITYTRIYSKEQISYIIDKNKAFILIYLKDLKRYIQQYYFLEISNKGITTAAIIHKLSNWPSYMQVLKSKPSFAIAVKYDVWQVKL